MKCQACPGIMAAGVEHMERCAAVAAALEARTAAERALIDAALAPM